MFKQVLPIVIATLLFPLQTSLLRCLFIDFHEGSWFHFGFIPPSKTQVNLPSWFLQPIYKEIPTSLILCTNKLCFKKITKMFQIK